MNVLAYFKKILHLFSIFLAKYEEILGLRLYQNPGQTGLVTRFHVTVLNFYSAPSNFKHHI